LLYPAPDVLSLSHHLRLRLPGRRLFLCAALVALASCSRKQGPTSEAPSEERRRVLVETLFVDLPAEPRNVALAERFNDIATGKDGTVLSNPNLLVDEGDVGELALPPTPHAAGAGGLRATLDGMRLRARPHLTGDGKVRLEFDVDLRSGEQTRPVRASFDGRLGQAFLLDPGVEMQGRRLAIVVTAEAVRTPDATTRLRDRDVSTRDDFGATAGGPAKTRAE
jgi:hypothetical protein